MSKVMTKKEFREAMLKDRAKKRRAKELALDAYHYEKVTDIKCSVRRRYGT